MMHLTMAAWVSLLIFGNSYSTRSRQAGFPEDVCSTGSFRSLSTAGRHLVMHVHADVTSWTTGRFRR